MPLLRSVPPDKEASLGPEQFEEGAHVKEKPELDSKVVKTDFIQDYHNQGKETSV